MLTDKDIEQMKRESVERRNAHPKWPSHKAMFYPPHGRGEIVCETMPVGKAKGVHGYCKYCHTTHNNWWAMDVRESLDGESMFLCGICEHTSLQGMLLCEPASPLPQTLAHLQIITRRNTKALSPHQNAAFDTLESYLKRSLAFEIKFVACDRCKSVLECVRWTENGTIADTWGYIEFENEKVCHRCLDEGYIGDILMPTKPTEEKYD